MAIVLGGIGLFVYLRFERELEASIDERLRSRAADLSGLVREAEFESSETRSAPVGDGGEDFAQVLEANGRVVGGTARLRNRSLLSYDELLLGRDALRVDVARERRPARAHARVVEVVPAPVRLPRPPRLGRRLLRPHLLDLLRGVEQVLVAQVEPQRQQVNQADRERQLVPLALLIDVSEDGVHRAVGKGSAHGARTSLRTDTTGRVAQDPMFPFWSDSAGRQATTGPKVSGSRARVGRGLHSG